MSCRILLLLCTLLLGLWPAIGQAVSVEVQVEGVEPPLYDNVMARLGINLHRQSPRLRESDVKRLHKQAKEDIRAALAPYGYYRPEITAKLTQQDGGYLAHYVIVSGPPVVLRDLAVRVDGPAAARELFSAIRLQFPLQPGAILNQGVYERGKKSIIRHAINHGFLTARFSVHELRIDRKAMVADVQLTLDTGPLYVFGKTTSIQRIIRPELLQRYRPYREGDPYRPAQLVEFRKALYRTDYFSRVTVQGDVDDADGVAVPVTVSLATPQHLNRYSLGVGYATDTGARALLDWRNRLLNSNGHKLRGVFQVSELENTLGLTYEIPRGNPSNDNYTLGASYHDKVWEETDIRLLTAGVGLEHQGRLFRHGGSLEYRDEDYSVGVTEGHSRLLMPSFNATLIWADNILNTRYGLQVSFNVSGALEGVVSDTTFVKGEAGGKLILSLADDLRLIGRGTVGATMVDSIHDIPPSLRFYAGGDQSIRGYSYKELGPEDASGAVVGGRYLMVGSLELEKTVSGNWSVAAFWDVGNAMDDIDIDFKQGVGGGVRFRLPFGQIRLDLASAILEDGAPMRLHLTVGGDL